MGLAGWSAPGLPTNAYGKAMARSDTVLVQQEVAKFGAHGSPGGPGSPSRRAHDRHARHPGADRPLRPRDRHRAEGLVPALQRAPGRVGPGRPPDEGHQGRRRVDRQRAEGVDIGRPVRRPRHAPRPDRPRGAQAPRDLLLRLRDAPRRGGGPAPQGDDRARALQRGLHHRRPGGRLRAHRRPEQRVGRRQHDAGQRAGRPRLRRRQRGRWRDGSAGHRHGHARQAGRRPRRAQAHGGKQAEVAEPGRCARRHAGRCRDAHLAGPVPRA